MKRITRKNPLTDAEAAEYDAIRAEIDAELPDLIARHRARARAAAKKHVAKVIQQLKAARQRQKKSLADIASESGMQRAAIQKLEAGKATNPTLATILRYAEAVGKKVSVTIQ